MDAGVWPGVVGSELCQDVGDGPFVELKETLGGYYVFECDSFDEACTWAAKIPAARHGAIEVRTIVVDEEKPS